MRIKPHLGHSVFDQVMRQRLNIPDNEGWEGPSDRELAEFLRGIDRRQRRLLKQIAEGLD